MKLALIGYGTIAGLALKSISEQSNFKLEQLTILVRAGAGERARAMINKNCRTLARDTRIVDTCRDIIDLKPDLIAEAASHEALRECGAAFLQAGIDLVITSVGALADGDLRNRLDGAAATGRSRYQTIAGAVGGLDILSAARLAGIQKVTYISRKPPKAWKGTKAEALLDLDAVSEPAVFFEGPADEAAQTYPLNANVAATIALAGSGFANTHVKMIADPAISRNVHELAVRSACADFSIRIEGFSAPDNPKTSLTTAYSLAQAILEYAQRHGR